MSSRIGDQLLDKLRFAHGRDTGRIQMKTSVLEIASSQDDLDRRLRRDLSEVLDLLVCAPIRRQRHQGSQSIGAGRLQLFYHQLNITADMFVHERRTIHECVGRNVFQEGADDRTLWHVDGADACEDVLSRRQQGFTVPGQPAGSPEPNAHPEHLKHITPIQSPRWPVTTHH